jgi:hypothetical protein
MRKFLHIYIHQQHSDVFVFSFSLSRFRFFQDVLRWGTTLLSTLRRYGLVDS